MGLPQREGLGDRLRSPFGKKHVVAPQNVATIPPGPKTSKGEQWMLHLGRVNQNSLVENKIAEKMVQTRTTIALV